MTPQNDAKYTSLLFTPRTTESARGLPDYRWALQPASTVNRATGGRDTIPADDCFRHAAHIAAGQSRAGSVTLHCDLVSANVIQLYLELRSEVGAAPERRGT